MAKIFKEVRSEALAYWLKYSGRTREEDGDDCTDNTHECDWQRKAGGTNGDDRHVSLFCGIGDWASHITDILSDVSQDKLLFSNPETERRIARHYARLLFVVSELLDDLVQALMKLKALEKRRTEGVN